MIYTSDWNIGHFNYLEIIKYLNLLSRDNQMLDIL